MRICPNCRREMTTTFCPECGVRTERACPQCNTPIEEGQRFCGDCGAALSTSTPAQAAHAVPPREASRSVGDIGLVRGNVDQSSHTTAHIGAQTNITGGVSISIAQQSADPTPEDILERGKRQLRQGLFDVAAETLSTPVDWDAAAGEALFYLALAKTKGKRPRLLAWSAVREIDDLLDRATQLDPTCAQAYALRALVKHDYYVMNRLSCPPPSVSSLRSRVPFISKQQAGDIVSSMSAPGNTVWEWLVTRS